MPITLPMLKLDLITLFPDLFNEYLNVLPLKRAIQKNLAQVTFHNVRKYAMDKYGTVDDTPYGGGVGMVMMIEPIYKCLLDIYGTEENFPKKDTKRAIIYLSPTGTRYTQAKAREFSQHEQITLICGRYEGIDARIMDYATEIISIGDYVLSGGEVAAQVIMESVVRLIPGVLEKSVAVTNESFSEMLAEYPQYTKPEEFMGKKVPDTLLSGNHKEIEKWKAEHSIKY